MLVRRKRSESGSAIVELALMSPWLFFLFVGIFAFGFYIYAAINVQSAASIAAAQTSSGPGSATQLVACQAAVAEMKLLPNNSSFVVPSSDGSTPGCNAAPLTVTQATLCGSSPPPTVVCGGTLADGTTVANAHPTTPTCGDCAQDNTAASSRVGVVYQSVKLVPIPGLLTGQMNLTRVAETRIVVQ